MQKQTKLSCKLLNLLYLTLVSSVAIPPFLNESYFWNGSFQWFGSSGSPNWSERLIRFWLTAMANINTDTLSYHFASKDLSWWLYNTFKVHFLSLKALLYVNCNCIENEDQNSLQKNLLLCWWNKGYSYRFGTTWGWVNSHRIVIFGWTIQLNII